MSQRRFLILCSAFVVCVGFSGAPQAADRKASETNAAAIARLQTDLKFLTSDECEGRGPGTKGIDLAADHIAGVFKESGLQPAMPDGSYFQPFQVRGQMKVTQPTRLVLGGPEATITPKLTAGFNPMAMGANGNVKGDIVFVGYGITAPDQNYDDYAGLDVEGKIVLMLRRLPNYGSKDKPFAPDETIEKLASIQSKLENAQEHKAIGVLLVNDTTAADEFNDDISRLATLTGGSIKIPAAMIKRHLAASLIRPAFGQTLGEVEEKINKELKPLGKSLADCTAELEVTINRNPIDVKNVVGVLPGAGPLANETVVIGAHYDHLGYGGPGSFVRGTKAIHHGADDNGSGTTSILELARRFGAIKDRQGRRLVFIAFTGEEINLLGSAHYCKEPIFPLDATVAMLNMDMVGRLSNDKETNKGKLEIGGTGTAKQFDAMLDKLADKYEFKLKKSPGGTGPSDHQSFFMKKLPVLFMFTGLHTDYHRPTDTWDKINFEGMSRIVDLMEDVTREVMVMDPKPDFINNATSMQITGSGSGSGRPMGPKLGIMADYGDPGPGVLLQGVSPGGAAEAAGLKAEDRIIEIAGTEIKDMQVYMAEMRKFKAGQEISIVVTRTKDGKQEKVTLKATPK